MAKTKRVKTRSAESASTTRKPRDRTSHGNGQPIARRFVLPAVVAGLLLVHFVLAITSVLHKSNTYDELAHLTRGYSYTLTDDFRLGPPHPPLVHYWAAIPGWSMAVKAPKRDQAAWRTSDVWVIGRQFFYYKNLGNAAMINRLLFRGRTMIALLSVCCGVLVFFWSRRLFGDVGGVISLTLFALSPTMLAHGRLVTTDCAVTLFFLAGLTVVWWVLHTVSIASVLTGAVVLGGLFLSKMSAPLIIPVGLSLIILRAADRQPLIVRWFKRRIEIASRPKRVGIWLGVMVFWIVCVWVCIWGTYGFRYDAMTGLDADQSRFYSPNPVPKDKTVWEHQLRGLDHLAPVITFLRDRRLLPEAYVYNAAFAAQTARGRNAFLNGEINILGFRSFFPYTFLVKTPLPLFALLIVAAAALSWSRPATAKNGDGPPVDSNRRHESSIGWLHVLWHGAPLWIFFALYWTVSIRSHLNIGHRHILPTYPMLFIFCGAAAFFWGSRSAPLRWLTLALVGLFAIASLISFPNYLAYFNSIVGGPDHAYRHLVDSSLDWGQDLPGFKRWLDRYRRAPDDGRQPGPAHLAYFGSGGNVAVTHHGIDCATLPIRLSAKNARGELRYLPGAYAISATALQQVYFSFRDPKTGRRQTGHQWTPEMESEFQRLKTQLEPLIASPDTAQARQSFADNQTASVFNQFAKLRFARLCANLREREPDENVNHTILIYHLDQSAVDDALHGPPPYPSALSAPQSSMAQ